MRARRTIASSTAAAAAVLALAGGAVASGLIGEDGTISACHLSNGNLRVVASTAECRTGEAPLTWNQKGEPGPAGPQGETGPAGPAGPQGPAGADGADATFTAQSCPAGQYVSGLQADGTIDCTPLPDGGSGPVDADADGYETPADCDDANASINPGAQEVRGNQVDENCDGVVQPFPGDVDADGDGFTPNQGDCDDTSSAVSPSATEAIGNSVDDDCDGQVDEGGQFGALSINEIDYDQPGADDFREFVELKNVTAFPVMLDGMRLRIFAGGGSLLHDITLSGTLSPDQRLVAGSGDVLSSVPLGTMRHSLGTLPDRLANGGGRIQIVGAGGETVNTLSYGNFVDTSDRVGVIDDGIAEERSIGWPGDVVGSTYEIMPATPGLLNF